MVMRKARLLVILLAVCMKEGERVYITLLVYNIIIVKNITSRSGYSCIMIILLLYRFWSNDKWFSKTAL